MIGERRKKALQQCMDTVGTSTWQCLPSSLSFSLSLSLLDRFRPWNGAFSLFSSLPQCVFMFVLNSGTLSQHSFSFKLKETQQQQQERQKIKKFLSQCFSLHQFISVWCKGNRNRHHDHHHHQPAPFNTLCPSSKLFSPFTLRCVETIYYY